ncbi:MAG: LysM peptidoglycan-binding domain-containing protein [Phycisphaeraceae bacterium]
MARETKIAMLIGLGVILLIGIIISDHLATVQGTGGGDSITQFGQRADRALGEADDPGQVRRDAEVAADRVAAELNRTIPRPEELDGETEPPAGTYDAPPPTDLRAMRVESRRAASPNVSQVDRWRRAAADGGSTTGVPQSLEFSRSGRAQVETASEAEVDRASEEREPASASNSASAAASDSPAGGRVIHYLEEGETLYDVARKYLGNGDKWEVIVAANREAVPNPDLVTAGLRLVIPASADDVSRRGESEARSSASTSQPASQPARGRTIEVQPGDTLYEIAEKHLGNGKRWREILEANDSLDRETDLRSGMSIQLPPTRGRADASASDRDRTSSASTRSDGEPSRATTYEVQAGDTLAKIARRVLGDADRWEDVYAANRDRLDDPDAIRAGQTLRIPR